MQWGLRGTASRLVACLLLTGPAAAETRVSIELVLAVDVSISVNDPEYLLQMHGIAAAFRDPEVGALIEAHEHGVAVTITHWSGTWEADQPLPWAVLAEAPDALAYSRAILLARRTKLGNFTGLGNAISYASHLIATNGYEGDEKKIDVSGDGRNNTGPEPRETRLEARARGITINGLAVIGDDPGLASYYAANVIAGPEAFMVPARDFESFAEAFKRKLKRELSPRMAHRPSPRLAAKP